MESLHQREAIYLGHDNIACKLTHRKENVNETGRQSGHRYRGGRGNGLAAARCMAKEGAHIAVADICANMKTIPYDMSTPDTMADAVAGIKELGRDAIGIQCDVRKAADVEAMVKKVVEKFGKIDILVNNAGNTSMVAIAEIEEEVWDEVIDTHLKGMYLCCHYVLPHMISRHSGKVVSISSVGSRAGWAWAATTVPQNTASSD